MLDNLEHFCEGGKRVLDNLKGSWKDGKRVLDNSKGSRKRGKRVLEILKGPKTLLGSKTLFPLTPLKVLVLAIKAYDYFSLEFFLKVNDLDNSTFCMEEIHSPY